MSEQQTQPRVLDEEDATVEAIRLRLDTEYRELQATAARIGRMAALMRGDDHGHR